MLTILKPLFSQWFYFATKKVIIKINFIEKAIKELTDEEAKAIQKIFTELSEKMSPDDFKKLIDDIDFSKAEYIDEIKRIADGLGVEVKGVGKRVDEALGEVADLTDATNGVIKGVGNQTPLENGPYIKDGKPNGRPTLTGKSKLEFEQKVYENSLSNDGILRDPNTQEIIDWKPGETRKGVVDFGHKQGLSYDEMFQKYKSGDISLDELKEFQFNPENYQLETPSSNRSHLFE